MYECMICQNSLTNRYPKRRRRPNSSRSDDEQIRVSAQLID